MPFGVYHQTGDFTAGLEQATSTTDIWMRRHRAAILFYQDRDDPGDSDKATACLIAAVLKREEGDDWSDSYTKFFA